jgi:hypothetical protein
MKAAILNYVGETRGHRGVHVTRRRRTTINLHLFKYIRLYTLPFLTMIAPLQIMLFLFFALTVSIA